MDADAVWVTTPVRSGKLLPGLQQGADSQLRAAIAMAILNGGGNDTCLVGQLMRNPRTVPVSTPYFFNSDGHARPFITSDKVISRRGQPDARKPR
jgi:hypothetical protein